MHVRRFYENELPELGDFVTVRITREEEHGYYGNLLEYDTLEGFIPISELVNKKYTRKKHLLTEDQIIVMQVNRIEESKREVNLTRKRITPEEDESQKIKYRLCDEINKLINEYYTMYLSYQKKEDCPVIDINEFMKETIWLLYDEIEYDYNKIYNSILKEPKCILSSHVFDTNLVDKIDKDVTGRISYTSKIINLDITLLVTDNDPLGVIKQILTTNIVNIDSNYRIRVLAVSSPHYQIKIEGPLNPTNKICNEITDIIKNQLTENSKGHNVVIKINDPIVEKESTYTIKYYSKHDLLKL